MKLSINDVIHAVEYHPCSDSRAHYCIAVLNDKNQPVSAHTLPKSWPYMARGKIKTGGNTYKWIRA